MRARLAERVTEVLLADARVVSVELGGSLVHGKHDAHSDIDLMAMLRRDVADRDFFFDLARLMEDVGPSVPGWGFVAFPHAYVGTFHFDDQPLFWGVDIVCISPLHVDSSDLIQVTRWEQIYKMWIHAAKQTVRAEDKLAEVRRLTARHIDVPHVPTSAVDQLEAVLDAIGRLKSSRGDPYEEFHARCVALCAELRGT